MGVILRQGRGQRAPAFRDGSMNLLVGTSGFSYTEWKGSFYPKELPDKQMLRYYGERFGTVEINNTFYRMPSKKVLQGWAEEVPAAFRFAVKATRRVTHFRRLRDVGNELDFLFSNLAALGDKLGPVLFQLPPNLPCDMPLLQDFLAQLPPQLRCVLEFRDPSWFADGVYAALRDSGVALCGMEEDDVPAQVQPTARFGYFRLRRSAYTVPLLRQWAERIRAQPWEEAFVYFKHDTEAPLIALEFAGVLRG